MEFTPLEIARLVLGYLKTEKCHTAFDIFYKTSPHFEQSNKNKVRSKYIITRVHGYDLREYLSQYAQISNLVQERLEPTNYYEEDSSRNLLDQLKYLLDKYCPTRSSTPQRSRSSTPIKDVNRNKSLFQQNLSIIEEHITPELNTTPLESLPGNSNEFVNRPKKRTGIKTNKNTIVDESDSGDSPDNGQEEEEEDIEVLKQTLLERTELHEKIAENINLVIKPSIAEEKANNELESAIKAVVEKTEADPMFDKLISDLIRSTAESDETDKNMLEQDCLQTPKSTQTLHDRQQTLNKEQEKESETIKQRLRSPKKQPNDGVQESADIPRAVHASPEKSVNTTENLQKCQNIKQTENTTPINVDIHKNLTVNTGTTSDIIVYDGTLDNYMKTSTTSVINPGNPIFFNNNLLMVQPNLIQPPATITAPIIHGIPVDSKPYYVLNNSQLINVSAPQYKLNNVTEQDILNMPTVIVCDDNNQQPAPNWTAKPSAPKEPVKILPKETPEPNLREYLTLYQCSDEQSPVKSKTILAKPQNVEVPKAQTIQIEVLKCPDEGVKEVSNKSDQQQSDVAPREKPASPRPGTPEGNKQAIRKSTPKSGSHVRALDFNLTPGQSSLTGKRLDNTSKSPRKKSPSKISTTKISKSLFGSPSKQVKVESNESKGELKEVEKTDCKTSGSKQKSLSSWDADLRASMGLVKPPSPVKKKKKEPTKKPVKKAKPNLNKTEVDAEAIEANLKEMDLEVDSKEVKSEVPKELANETVNEESTQECAEKTENDEDQSVFTVALINCNAKPRFKKKCNTDNNISKTVKITKVKEIKSLEIVPDGSNKLILSPSKLNANKRTLVDNTEKEVDLVSTPVDDSPAISAPKVMEPKIETEERKVVQNNEIVSPAKTSDPKHDNTENVKHDTTNVETAKMHNTSIITPEMLRDPKSLPVTANRNLTPVLETPMKFIDTSLKIDELPKTPGEYSPSNDINTPMTKLLNEQLRGVDLLSIPTPKFPLTPTFPFTPFNTKSPYPNRSTDYSTSSSYYHPSDSEQNKSLEALMEECRRLENKKPSPEKEMNLSPAEVPIQPTINEKISSFNHSVIARKNLSLVKKDLQSSTSGESSSSEECSSCTDGDTDSNSSIWNSKNDTVVSKRAGTPYMLRPRKKEEKEEKAETIPKVVPQGETKIRLEQSTLSCKETLLKEIEEKRKRTIAKFKQGEKPPPKKKQSPPEKTTPTANRNSTPKNASGKSRNDSRSKKRVKANVAENKNTKSVNKRKSKSPVKLLQNSNNREVRIQERDILLHISSDDDQIKPFDVVETQLLESSSSPTDHPLTTFQRALDSLKSNIKPKESNDITSDQEAKILVEGLKQRGIYLVPKKTPKKIDQTLNTNNEQIENGHVHSTNVGKNPDEAMKVLGEKGTSPEKQVIELEIVKITSQQQNNETTVKTDVQKPLKGEKKEKDNKKKNTLVSTKIDDKTTNQMGSENAIASSLPNNIEDKSKQHQTDTLKTNAVQNTVQDSEVLNKKDPIVKTESKNQNRKKPNQVSAKNTKNPTETRVTKRTTTKAPKKDLTKGHSKKPQTQSNDKITENKEPKKSTTDKGEDGQSINLNENVSTELVTQNQNIAAPTTEQHVDITATVNRNIEQDLNLTDSVNDEVFDDVLYTEQTLNIVYDPNNTCGKTLKDYDLPISNRCILVEVYGQQIEMSVTPFEMIFDTSRKNPKEKVIILQNTVITTGKKSSDKLHKRTDMNTNSPLYNLYSDCSGASYSANNMKKLKSNERRRNSVDHRRESAPKLGKPTRSKSVDCNISTRLSKKEQNSEDIKLAKKDTEKSSISSEKDDEIRDVDGVSPITKPSPREIDDDLMNYAICGSERVENDTEGRSGTKRKAKDDIGDSEVKKMKTQDILNAVNLDVFLTQLHG